MYIQACCVRMGVDYGFYITIMLDWPVYYRDDCRLAKERYSGLNSVRLSSLGPELVAAESS